MEYLWPWLPHRHRLKSDIINEKIPRYIKENIKTYSKDLSLTEASYTGYKYMTDNGGYGVEEQIIKYMKNAQ